MQVAHPLKVQFAHGLEGSPTGNKATVLSAAFDVHTPSMNVRDIPSCIALHERALEDFKPDVLIGSSFGGAIVLALLRSGAWRGPTLLLAQAALGYDPSSRLPPDAHVWLVHGTSDELIDVDDSRRLAATGQAPWVRLLEVDDDHALRRYVAAGDLVRHVRELHSVATG